MGNISINGTRSNGGTRIADIAAGDAFDFNGSTKGNNGLCVRVKDSKSGKGRFLNLENGKLLTATDSDYGYPRSVSVSFND